MTGVAPPADAAERWWPRLVALDVDGTLPAWSEVEQPIPEPPDSRLRAMFRRAVAAGSHIVLCSGRSPHGMTRVLDRLGLAGPGADRCWLVAGNGAMVCRYPPLEIVRATRFDPAPAVRTVLASWPTARVAIEDGFTGYLATAAFPAGELPGETRIIGLAELLARPVSRVIIRDPDSTPADFRRLAAGLGLEEIDYTVGYTAWLDLVPRGVSKASGLQHACERLGIAARDVLAVGNAGNDLDLIRWAGRGVAVADASPELLAAADDTTAAADDDGVAVELARWFS